MNITLNQFFKKQTITPVFNQKRKESTPTFGLQLKSQPKSDIVSFKNIPLHSSTALLNELKSSFGNKKLQTLLKDAIAEAVKEAPEEANCGRTHKYFRLNAAPDFGVRIEKSADKFLKVLKDMQFLPVTDLHPDKNFGQMLFETEIPWANIVKHVEGEPSSINHWYHFYQDTELIGRKESKQYFEKILKTSKMPQTAFDVLESDLNVINNEAAYNLDTTNPNNLMIDFMKDKFTFIDLQDNWAYKYNNDFDNLFRPMTDSILKKYFVRFLDSSENIMLDNAIQEIYKKASTATNTILFQH